LGAVCVQENQERRLLRGDASIMVLDYTASHTFTDIIKKTSDLTGQMDMITKS
jgi:hypothetical protein